MIFDEIREISFSVSNEVSMSNEEIGIVLE